jgi:Protein of unknown function (DUF4231)
MTEQADQALDEPTGSDKFEKELRQLVNEQVLPCYKWYSTHKTWPRIMFRGGGMIVVIGSLTLPTIAASSMQYREILLTIVSLAVAVLSSLNAFFRWDATWRSRTRAAYSLQGLLATWEFNLSAAKRSKEPERCALQATESLFKDAFALVGSETDEFFANIRWPEAPKPRDA